MGLFSAIEWTESSWNPTRGCSRESIGCIHCYAERFAHRFSAYGEAYAGLTKSTRNGPRWTGKVVLAEDAIDLPLRWRKPRLIFVNSMSDLFHERLSYERIARVFDIMTRADWHTFQILTKRSKRLLELAPRLPWPPNIWMGVSVESQEYIWRIDDLIATEAVVKFVSLEPLLGPVTDLPLKDLDWIIVGGESGPGAREIRPEWVRLIRDEAIAANIPFFFKQWGGPKKKAAGRKLDGRTWDELPSRAGNLSQTTLF